MTNELTAAMTADTRPGQDQARQNTSMDGGGVHKAPPLAEKLWVVDVSWRKEQSIFFRDAVRLICLLPQHRVSIS